MKPRNVDRVIADAGRRIAELRRDAELTQEALAARLGVSVQYVRRIESGSNLTLRSLATVARALGHDAVELLGIPTDRTRPRPGRPVTISRR